MHISVTIEGYFNITFLVTFNKVITPAPIFGIQFDGLLLNYSSYFL